MATVNLGAIKFKWKGTYNALTAYTIDDVVEYNGSSYICILASTGNLPTNATYFEQMSQKGTDADLLNIASTAQGDIYYNNGSAIARLGAGTSGQVLQTNGTGANPSWGDVSGGLLQVVQSDNNSFAQNTSSTTFVDIESSSGVTWETAITPSSTSSKILIMPTLMLGFENYSNDNNRQEFNMSAKIGTGSYTQIFLNHEYGIYLWSSSGGSLLNTIANPIQLYEPNTTDEVKIKFGIRASAGGNSGIYTSWGGSPSAIQRCILMEIGV